MRVDLCLVGALAGGEHADCVHDVAVLAGEQFGRLEEDRGAFFPAQRGPGVVECSRETMLGREAIVQCQHGAATAPCQLAAQAVVGLQIADHETAPVQVEHHTARLRPPWREPVAGHPAEARPANLALIRQAA